MEPIIEMMSNYKEIVCIVISLLTTYVVYVYEMKKNNLELMIAGEASRKKHDVGIVLVTCIALFALNVEFGIIITGLGRYEYIFFGMAMLIFILTVLYNYYMFKEKKDPRAKNKSQAIYILFLFSTGVLVSVFSVIMIFISIKGMNKTFAEYISNADISVLQDLTIDFLNSHYLSILVILSIIEGLVIGSRLLTMSVEESNIKIFLYDNNGNPLINDKYVCSRIGDTIICGNEAILRKSTEINVIKMDDICQSYNTYFSYIQNQGNEKSDTKKIYFKNMRNLIAMRLLRLAKKLHVKEETQS